MDGGLNSDFAIALAILAARASESVAKSDSLEPISAEDDARDGLCRVFEPTAGAA